MDRKRRLRSSSARRWLERPRAPPLCKVISQSFVKCTQVRSTQYIRIVVARSGAQRCEPMTPRGAGEPSDVHGARGRGAASRDEPRRFAHPEAAWVSRLLHWSRRMTTGAVRGLEQCSYEPSYCLVKKGLYITSLSFVIGSQ